MFHSRLQKIHSGKSDNFLFRCEQHNKCCTAADHDRIDKYTERLNQSGFDRLITFRCCCCGSYSPSRSLKSVLFPAPVSKTSVVNFRIPSTQSSTSRIALVVISPSPSSRRLGLLFPTRFPYRILFILRLTLFAKRRT